MPLAGAAIGAASGAIGGALTDVGINDKWMKDTAAAIQPGTAALFVLVRKVTGDKVLEGLRGEGGTVMKTSPRSTTPRKRRCRRLWPVSRRRCRSPPSHKERAARSRRCCPRAPTSVKPQSVLM